MQIDPHLPFHIANAYGLKPTPISRPPVASRSNESASTQPLTFATHPKPASPGLANLVAGHVNRSVEFRPALGEPTGGATFQLYTRAADKLEAAIGVHLGRGIDVKG